VDKCSKPLACGLTPCTIDANSLSRHLHVTPGAEVYVSNLRLVNGSAVSQACYPFTYGRGVPGPPGSAAGCIPSYFGYGVWAGALARFPGLSEALGNPTIGDEVRPHSLHSVYPNCAQYS
jgi:hypothetical protein